MHGLESAIDFQSQVMMSVAQRQWSRGDGAACWNQDHGVDGCRVQDVLECPCCFIWPVVVVVVVAVVAVVVATATATATASNTVLCDIENCRRGDNERIVQ